MLFRSASIATALLCGRARLKRTAARKFMEDALAYFRIEIGGSEFFALLAQLSNPRLILRTKLLLEFLANSLRESRALAGSRDCNLQVAALYNGRIVEIAILRVINRVAKNPFGMCLSEDSGVH